MMPGLYLLSETGVESKFIFLDWKTCYILLSLNFDWAWLFNNPVLANYHTNISYFLI